MDWVNKGAVRAGLLIALVFLTASASAHAQEDVIMGPDHPDYAIAHGAASQHYVIATYPGVLLPYHYFTGYYAGLQKPDAGRHLLLSKTDTFAPKSLALQNALSESGAAPFTFSNGIGKIKLAPE